MKIISRKEAKALGLTRYFTGKSCKWGHEAERSVSCASCCVCAARAADKYRSAHPEMRAASWKKYVATRTASVRASQKKYRANNRDKLVASSRSFNEKMRALVIIAREIIPEITEEIGL